MADFECLRQALLPEPVDHVFVHDDGAEGIPFQRAAVLFPIVDHRSGPTVLFTQRSAGLRDHPGQISFPGGSVEPGDCTPVDTAMREAEEEIGLGPEHVSVLGFLPEYRTGTGFAITPVVGLVVPPFSVTPDPFEVAEIFEVPLNFLLDSANHKRHTIHYRGKPRQFYAMPWGDYFIWGATAGIIRSLFERLPR